MDANRWYDPVTGTYTTWDNDSGYIPVFIGIGGTVSLASAASMERIALLGSGFTLSGGSIILTGEDGGVCDCGFLGGGRIADIDRRSRRRFRHV